MPEDAVHWEADFMKLRKPIESLILTIRGRKVLIDADCRL